MNRYLFRGKREDNGEWVYGDLIQNPNTTGKCLIIERGVTSYSSTNEAIKEYLSESYIEVIPETVGQYTGLKDESGKEIYEGDILQNYFIDDKQILECRYYDCGLVFEDKKDYSHRVLTNARIIGTIFDKDNVLKED